MKRVLLAILSLAILLVGCASGGEPKAVISETRYDFGEVVTSSDPKDTKTHVFTIRNEGTGTLKLQEPQVETLEGC